MLCAHSYLLPTERDDRMENAVVRAVAEVLGSSAIDPSNAVVSRPGWPILPKAETTILSVRKTHPQRADEVLSRARDYYLATV